MKLALHRSLMLEPHNTAMRGILELFIGVTLLGFALRLILYIALLSVLIGFIRLAAA